MASSHPLEQLEQPLSPSCCSVSPACAGLCSPLPWAHMGMVALWRMCVWAQTYISAGPFVLLRFTTLGWNELVWGFCWVGVFFAPPLQHMFFILQLLTPQMSCSPPEAAPPGRFLVRVTHEYQDLSYLFWVSGGLMSCVGWMERAPAVLRWCLETGLHALG